MTAGFGTTVERLADETARLEGLRADLAETTRGTEEARLLGVISQRMHTAEHLLAQLILIGQFRGAEIPHHIASTETKGDDQ